MAGSMAEFRIGVPLLESAPSGNRLSIPVDAGGRTCVVDFTFPEILAQPEAGDALVGLFLMPAMKLGLPLRLPLPVSPRLRESLPRIQEIASNWFRGFRNIPVHLPDVDPAPRPKAGGRASFFSAGLDSWHTILRHRHHLDHVVFVHGYDRPGTCPEEQRAVIGRRMREAAKIHGIPFHEVHTNYREHGEDFLGEYEKTHGAALASIGHFFSPLVGQLLTPSSGAYDSHSPWGSSHCLDPLWSSDVMDVRYDGGEWTRAQKATVVREHPSCLPHLIVCLDGYTTGKNCGRCEKCLRTMCGLLLAGLDDLSPAFHADFSLEAVQAIRFRLDYYIEFWEELAAQAREAAPDSELRKAIDRVLVENRLQRDFKALKALGDQPLPPVIASALAPIRNRLWAGLAERSPGWLARRIRSLAKARPDKMREVLWS